MKHSYFFLLVFLCLATACKRDQISINELKCEYQSDPLGIDIPDPRLSWKLSSPFQAQKQTAYQVLAASKLILLDPEKADLWNSGRVKSGQSIHIPYDGEKLQKGMQVFWRVKIWDAFGNPSEWSDPAKFEMGILPSDWQAKWISMKLPPNTGSQRHNPAYYFRKDISISDDIKKARAYISGLGYYELYINGKKVGDHVLSPNHTNYGWREPTSFQEEWVMNMSYRSLYETYDISDYLKEGDNTLAVCLGNGWFFQNERKEDITYSYNTPRFISQFEIEFSDDTRKIVLSDETWKASTGPIIHNGVYSGEIFDARLKQEEWNSAEFSDNNWEPAILAKAPEGKLMSQMSPPDRIIGIIHPISVMNPKENIYRFDLGQMISGWARIKMNGPKGTEIKMNFIEEMGPGYSQTDSYILKGEKTEIWEPRFTWHAFRYVDVSSAIPMTIESLQGIIVNTDVKSVGEFNCSYPLFNKINENFRWTQLGNLHGGVPSDCPHRERRGYTGDGQIAADAAIYNFDMAAFYTKWLNDIADAQNSKTGYVPNTVPYQSGSGGTAWGAAYVIIPWYMYLYYGDTRILEQHYSGMKKWMGFLQQRVQANGLIKEKNLGEWVPPEKTEIPPDFVSTAYYYHCLKLMSEISELLDKSNDSELFEDLVYKTKVAFNNEYLDQETMSYSIGRQGANVFPLGFGLVPEEFENDVFKTLVHHIETNTKGHFDTGMMATPLLLKVLSRFGRTDLAYTLMSQRDFPSFGYQIDKGATTIWETWQGDASHSHPMFGSVCEWFYSSLAGINPDQENPGFKHIIIKPQPVTNLEYAGAVYESIQGKIESKWEIKDKDLFLKVSIPANTTATVFVPAKARTNVIAIENDPETKPPIKYIGIENNEVEYHISSGNYEFKSKDASELFRESMLTAPRIIPSDTVMLSRDTAKVEILTDHIGASIRYTIDGLEPGIDSPIFSNEINVSKTSTIKARVFKSGMNPSPEKSSSLTFIDPQENGIEYDYFLGAWDKIPDLNSLSPFASGSLYNISLDNITLSRDQFALILRTKIEIPKSGEYTFYINSNDGSRFYIDDEIIIDNDGPHGATEKQGSLYLNKGRHSIVIHYFQAGGGYLLESSISGPEIEKTRIPASMLFIK
ncbi:MAG: family 78 glycoside hydrolase catalytic domain [Bacteroidales bacterium]|nr:family 78 glycoside hydrolase catalytic domain [Bacteroidales bacterium]